MELNHKFNFEKFKVSIWPTLWVVFFVFCLVVLGINLGQRAMEMTHILRLFAYLQNLMPLIIGILIFFNPRLGLVFLVFALSLAPYQTFGRISEVRRLKIRMEDYLIPFLYFIWMTRMWAKGKMRFVKVPITPPIVIFTLCLTFSTFFGVLVGWAELVPAFYYWLKYLEYFALFYLIVNLVNEDNDREILIYALIFASVLVSIWAIFQGITGFVFVTGRTGGRAAMPFDTEPATLGEYYIILIPLLLFKLFPRKGFFRIFFNALITIMAFLGLFFSLSRGSQVGLLIALPLILFILFKETRLAIILAGLLIFLFVFFPDVALNTSKFFLEDLSLNAQITIIILFIVSVILALIFIPRHRLVISVLALSIIIFASNPKFIVRLGSVAEEITSTGVVASYDEGEAVQITREVSSPDAGIITDEFKYRSFALRLRELWPSVIQKITINPVFGRGLTSIPVADNYYLRITAETGFIGLFVFLWLIFRLYKNILEAIKIAPSGSLLKILAFSMLITLTGLLIASFSDDAFLPVKVMMHFWLMTGLFYSAFTRFEQREIKNV